MPVLAGPNQGRGVIGTRDGLVNLFAFPAHQISLESVARALSQINRFGGRGHFPYSVAQHSVEVTRHIENPNWKPFALLHDAAEAFVGDVVAPLKPMLVIQDGTYGVRQDFETFERKIRAQILSAFGLIEPHDRLDMWQAIREADRIECAREYAALFPDLRDPLGPVYDPISPLPWQNARALFLATAGNCGIVR